LTIFSVKDTLKKGCGKKSNKLEIKSKLDPLVQ